MSSPPISRRERLRAEALGEISSRAEAQIAQGGVAALSLNGIARAMGMSGPAMYRYFASRDELLATVIAGGYDALADALADSARAARRRSPARRLQAVAEAYREWALATAHLYRLMFATPLGAGPLAPERIVPAAHRSMRVLLDAVAAQAGAGPAPLRVADARLGRQLTAWADGRGQPDVEPPVLLAGVSAWARLHGLVSLEIEGFFASMGLDGARLYAEEVQRIVGG